MLKPLNNQIMISLTLLIATGALAADPAKRPDVGDHVPSYASTKCGGIEDGVPAGKTLCYTCRAGEEPIFYVFAEKPSDPLVDLVKQIETLVIAKKQKKPAAVVNFLGDSKHEQARKDIADFGKKHDLRNVSLTISGDGEKFGVGGGLVAVRVHDAFSDPARHVAASVSLGGANHSPTHTTLVLTFGLTLCAPSMKALIPDTTSGMGKEAT